MFGIGTGELVVILLIVVVLFGATRLPEIGRSLGKAIKEFKKVGKDLETDITKTIDDDDTTKKDS